MRRRAVILLVLGLVPFARDARASTGVCDVSPMSEQTCLSQIESTGGVDDDIFTDSMGRTGDALPVYGALFNAWPGCPLPTAGCAGTSLSPFDCPGEYSCASVTNTFVNVGTYVNALDRLWWQPCRLSDHTLDVNGCPKFGTCIADGVGGSYFPWEGLVFDLGGPSNKVVLFAENDHGPQPCESLEYSVYLTDNPLARSAITDPLVSGVDPQQWNRAVLSKIYTKGFVQIRPPDAAGHGATCGDTDKFSVEEDSFVQVFSLPCGITFRYAAIVAGNDALDFPGCGYDSSEAEIDAVAGLTEQGAGVCPDADGDHFVDCKCLGAPAVCDCDDTDAKIHPGAPESCDDPDLNCDGHPGACDPALVCYEHVCRSPCAGEFCSGGTCEQTSAGQLCLPSSCVQGGCPAGQSCVNGSCVPGCTGVTCPSGQTCQDGECIDLCASTVCPNGEQCASGACGPPCTCEQGDLGCSAITGTVCDPDGACVPTMCKGVTCTGAEHCDPTTGACVAQCTGVACPFGESCIEGQGCVARCKGVTCSTGGQVCDPVDGTCKDATCIGVTCTGGLVCMGGSCIDTDGGMVETPDAAPGPDASGNPDNGTPTRGCCDVSGGAPLGSTMLGVAVIAMLVRRRRRREGPKIDEA